MILPTDSYKIYNKTIITEVDKNILVDLYQPIIGYKALSLYYSLLNDLDKKEVVTDMFTHHHLLSVMQISMQDIKISREKLEAIGLLQSYYNKEENSYIYVLYAPLSAKDFLNHPILNVVLFNNIGKKEYDNIIKKYKVSRINLKDYENISKKFDEVFKSVPVNSYFSNDEIISSTEGEINLKEKINFELLLSGIDSKIINEKAFNKDVKSLINNLSFLYDIDLSSMQNLIRVSLNEKGMIDKELLRKSARSFYQFENSGKLPSLLYKSNKGVRKTKSVDNSLSNRDKMIHIFESTDPYHFLKSKYKGGKVIMRDMKLIEELLIDLKLDPACINVLIDYALRANNQKLNKTYVETIASQWKRLGIKTAEEAMDACIKEYKKGKDKTKSKDTKIKEIKTPDWFNMDIEKKEIKKEEETELVNLIKKYE